MIPRLTAQGQAMMVLALQGTELEFTKLKIGKGNAPADYTALTDLVDPVQNLTVTLEASEESGYVQLIGQTLRNTDFDSDFYYTELGVFVTDPDGGDDLLYAYAHYSLSGDESPIYISNAVSTIIQITPVVHVYIGEAENVSAAISEASSYATKAELAAHVADDDNPHHVTKAQVGLSNVPNKSTNAQTPTYAVASSLSALVSGETLSTAMGKIALLVSKAITHFSDKVLHITADERTKWNGKAEASHTHSAAAVVAGTLSVARGGTGQTSVANFRKGFGFASGTVSITFTANAYIKKTINFASTLSFTPKAVTVTPQGNAEGASKTGYYINVTNLTTSGFTLECYAPTAMTLKVGYIVM